MSIFSDYNCGALSDDEYRFECNRINAADRYYEMLDAADEYYTDDPDDEYWEEEERRKQE